MSEFATYLTESTKLYDYKIKVAGVISDDFANKLETACQKFEVKKLSSGKKTPIQEMPLDFPSIKNVEVTIFELQTSYPVSAYELREYLADYLNLAKNQIVVKKPGEPSEEYQDQMQSEKTSEYKNKLMDIEYKDHEKVDAEDYHSTKANMSLLKELLKNRQEITHAEEDAKNKDEKRIQDKEEKGSPSPFTKSTNPHPDPKRK